LRKEGNMKLRLKISLLIILVIMMNGCGVSTKATITMGLKRPPISPEEVKIYDSIGKVPGKYEEIAILTSKGDYRHTDLADMYRSMRAEAAKIGANGLILGEIQEPRTRDMVLNAIFGTGSYRTGKATAILVFPPQEDETTTDTN